MPVIALKQKYHGPSQTMVVFELKILLDIMIQYPAVKMSSLLGDSAEPAALCLS